MKEAQLVEWNPSQIYAMLINWRTYTLKPSHFFREIICSNRSNYRSRLMRRKRVSVLVTESVSVKIPSNMHR